MDLQLTETTVFIAGSSRGIGKAIGEVLATEGCIIVLSGRDPNAVDAAVQDMKRKSGKGNVFGVAGDMTQTDDISKTLEEVKSLTGNYPDSVVASIGTGRSVVGWDVPDEEWSRMIEMNLLGAVRLTREFVRVAKDREKGAVVCIASIAGCDAIPAPIPYSAAKAALLSFVKNTADAIAAKGIRINAISPGNVMFEGSTWDRKIRENKTAVDEYINRVVPLKGFATPEDIAWMAAYLLSDKSKFITGSNVVVDGGQTRKFI